MRMLHQLMDELEGGLRSRLPQAPIRSTNRELEELAHLDAASVVTGGKPARLHLEPVTGPSNMCRFQFRSPFASGVTANDIVHGQHRAAPPPTTLDTGSAVVLLHGAFAPSFAVEAFLAGPVVEGGASMFALALPFHMDRAPGESRYSGQYLFSGDIPRLYRGVLQAAADVVALVSALRNSGCRSIALVGMSLGGGVAALSATLTPVDSLFLIMPVVDIYATIIGAPLARTIRRDAEEAGFTRSEIERAAHCITPGRLGAPLCDPNRVRVHYALYDRQVPAGVVELLLHSWEVTGAVAHRRGHRTMGFSLLSIRRDLASFLLEA